MVLTRGVQPLTAPYCHALIERGPLASSSSAVRRKSPDESADLIEALWWQTRHGP
ncbi:hypothetical protein [Streptomyces sp. 8K308]|uniref:hypothetical protein n=1 Tax=Streptomyces sp. 8K308 TaxID=2530388 RepID=UPI0014047849|nr:hypothetical protein [Streptomyces sp. 8K308]